MNLVKFITDGFGIGFLFGLAAYDEVKNQNKKSDLGKAFSFILWAVFCSLAYQYLIAKDTKPENKLLFSGGVIIGILSADKKINENKSN